MILNEKQREVTRERIESLKASLKAPPHPKVKPVLVRAARIQVQALINDLEAEIHEFDQLRSKGMSAIQVRTASDWLLLPVRFRIAKRMSQEAFSRLVGVSVRQIARYEAEGYGNIQTETLRKILDQLPLEFANVRVTEKSPR